MNIEEIPSYETLQASAGYPAILPAPKEDHQSVGSLSEAEAICMENQVEEILGNCTCVDQETCAATDTNNSEAINTVQGNLAEPGDDAVTAAKKFKLMAMHYSKCKWPSSSSSDSEVLNDKWESTT